MIREAMRETPKDSPADKGWGAGWHGEAASENPYKDQRAAKTWEKWRKEGKAAWQRREEIRRQKHSELVSVYVRSTFRRVGFRR